jgi:hypothetical protein
MPTSDRVTCIVRFIRHSLSMPRQAGKSMRHGRDLLCRAQKPTGVSPVCQQEVGTSRLPAGALASFKLRVAPVGYQPPAIDYQIGLAKITSCPHRG